MPNKIPNPYDRTEFRDGRILDYASAAFMIDCEIELGYRLSLIQGVGGAEASGGTHTKGRGADTASWDGARKERVFRMKGGASWLRRELPGTWGPHGHTMVIFQNRTNREGISDSGFAQIGLYDRVLDGLVGNRPDPNPFRPAPKVAFSQKRYEWIMRNYGLDGDKDLRPTRITKIRDKLVIEHHDIGEIIAMMKKVPEGDDDRRAFDREIQSLQRHRVQITDWLERMPKR